MSEQRPPYLEIEPTLDEYVVSFGGELVRDLLPLTPAFLNADYLFRKYKVVAELKTLEKDFFTEADYKKKMNELYAKWYDKGLVPSLHGKALIQSKNLPMECQLDMANVVKQPLGRIVNKANNQIRETKHHLGIPDYKGVLILVNNGNYSLESNAVMYLVSRLVNTQNTSIDSTIYFTLNMRADAPDVDKDILVWVDMNNRKDSDGASRDFLNSFRDGWMKFVSPRTGEVIPQIPLDKHEKLEEITFIREKLER